MSSVGNMDGFVTVKLVNSSGNQFHEFVMRKGLNLWVWLRKQNIPIGASCSGVGVCGACDVTLLKGVFMNERNEFESNTLSKNEKSPEARLACLCRVSEDITITASYW